METYNGNIQAQINTIPNCLGKQEIQSNKEQITFEKKCEG